jgi:ubiquinone/menaquinone biosynthesis C-methylase UbiE
MSSFVWMKVLESTPERYDRGIRMLSRGRIDDVYVRLAELVAAPGKRVLDIGCGTGGVSLACAARGASVAAIDIDAGMLEVARGKKAPAGSGSVEWLELGVAEIGDRFEPESLDAVVSCLAFSELSPDEQGYALEMALSRLVPGGVLAIGDEVLPESAGARLLHRLARWPLTLATYLFTQTTTRPVAELPARVSAAGFQAVQEERLWSGSFSIVHAVKPKAAA